MHVYHFYKRRLDRNTRLGLKLMLHWFAGLFLGFTAVRFYGDTLVSFLIRAAGSAGSWSSLLGITAFPLLLSACAVFLFHDESVFILCLLRGSTIGFLTGGVAAAFGSAGILVASLLLFSALVYSPFLLWYWWRRLTLGHGEIVKDTICGLAVCIVVWLVDLTAVSPYLADIINY